MILEGHNKFFHIVNICKYQIKFKSQTYIHNNIIIKVIRIETKRGELFIKPYFT